MTVFHAKRNRISRVPRHEASRPEMVDGLERTSRLYLAVTEKLFGMRRLGGGISAVAAEAMLRTLLEDVRVFASSDEASVDVDLPVVNPSGQPLARVPHIEPSEYSGFEATKIAWASPKDLKRLPFVRRFVLASLSDEARVASVLEGRLHLGDVQRVEFMFAPRVVNARQLRTDYA